jgi:hypothetical protein
MPAPFANTLKRKPAQRTAVQLRPHQETGGVRWRSASPWYITTGERVDGEGHGEVRPSAFNGLLGGFDAPSTVRRSKRFPKVVADGNA